MSETDRKFSINGLVEKGILPDAPIMTARPLLAKIIHPLSQAKQWVYDSITLLMLR